MFIFSTFSISSFLLFSSILSIFQGASHGQPRYFVLFSDMIMYFKIQGKVSPILPKTNGLECGCMLPLKNCKVETLVGKGVFKLICQREELILYSNDGSQSSEEWVGAISTAIIRHKSNSATLRKESSRRDPVKRPDIMKMRRESLGQILLLRKGILTPGKHKMVLRERKDLTSPGNSPIGKLFLLIFQFCPLHISFLIFEFCSLFHFCPFFFILVHFYPFFNFVHFYRFFHFIQFCPIFSNCSILLIILFSFLIILSSLFMSSILSFFQ